MAPALVLAALAVAYIVWLLSVSSLWHFFLPEDWLIFVGRPDPTLEGLFAPLNGHWYTATVAVHQVLLRWFGLESYLPFLLAQTAAHLACVGLVFVHVRGHAGPIAGVAAAALLLVLATSYENLYWLVELGFVAPIAIALVALRLADSPTWTTRRWIAIATLLLAGVMFSGVGLVMLVVVGVYLLGSPRCLVVAPAGIAYLVWATLWPSAYLLPGDGDPIAYVATVAQMLGDAFLGPSIPGGAIIALIVGAAAVAVIAGWRPHRLTWAAAAGVAALYVGVGYRGDWVPDLATPGRYLYPAAACILVGVGPVIPRLPIAGRFASAALLMVALAINIPALPRTALAWERATLFFRAQTTVVEKAGLRSPAFIEPYGLHAGDYLAAIERFGTPERSAAFEARLARPEMEAYAEAMRQRLDLAD
ncbi:MAG: hypothetical protein ABIQ58_08450 [Candidatus Limnocylindrales bacterium]